MTAPVCARTRAYTEPLALRLDPRVKTPAAARLQLAKLSREAYDQAVVAHRAFLDARALVARLDKVTGMT